MTVTWPSGHVQTFENLPVDRRYTVTEPSQPVPVLPEAARQAGQFEEVSRAAGLASASREEEADETYEQRLIPMRLNRRGSPESVIVKFPTLDAGTRALAQAMQMYELEVRFYRDLLPHLPDVSTPTCHFAELDEATGAFTLVLEDLSSRTRPGDVLEESTDDECSADLGRARPSPGRIVELTDHRGNALARGP